MDAQRELNVFDIFNKLIKSGIFITAVILYCVYFVTNFISSFGTADLYSNMFMKILSYIWVVPVVIVIVGLSMVLNGGMKYDINKASAGASVLKIGLIVKIVCIVINAYMSIFAVADAVSSYNYIGQNDTAGAVGVMGVLFSVALNIIFVTLLFKLVNTFLYSAECDVPMPDFGKGTAVCMIVLGSISVFSSMMTFIVMPLLGLSLLCYGAFYGMMSAIIFMYRAESKKLYYRREYLKHMSDWQQGYYR